MEPVRGGLIGTRPSRRPGPSTFSVALLLAAVVLAGCVLVFSGAVGSSSFRERFADAVSSPLALVATVCAVTAAVRARGRHRWGWSLLALGSGLWTLGETVWLLRRVLPSGSALDGVDDTFYLLGMAPVIVGTAWFPGRVWRGSDRLRAILDGVTVAGSIVFLARGLGLLQADAGPLREQLLDLAYPAGDVAMLCVALTVLIRAARPWYLSLGLLMVALASYAVGDTIFAVRSATSTYVSGTLLDLTWNLSYLLLALAALAPGAPGGASIVEDESSYRGRRAPWLLIGLAILVLAGYVLSDPSVLDDPAMAVIGALVVVTFSLRQAWVFRDLDRLNRRLSRQAESTERMAEAVVDGMLVVDRTGSVAYANEPAVALIGQDREQLVGRSITGLLHDPEDPLEDPPPISAPGVLEAMRTSSTVVQAAATFLRPDGTRVPVDVSVGPLSHDFPAGVVLVFRDASARRAVERMKNEFMSVISHEVRTPLTSIRGALALLDGGVAGPLEPTGSRLVSIALESSDRLSRLINDILDVERLESGSVHLDVGPQDAGRLVAAAEREMAGLALTAQVEVVTEPCTGTVAADADRIVQVLTNLLGNAIKFSTSGATVRIGAAPVGDVVEFCVADQGRGIPVDKQQSIFDRFQQVDSSDSRQKGGTGLGLAICRDVVRLHGGRIWVSSGPGVGAEFRFQLPRVAPADDAEVVPVGARALDAQAILRR